MYTFKKIIILLLAFSGFAANIVAQEASFKEAENAYAQEDYDKAIELYEDVLRNYGDSHAIYYNLGNAYYKKGKIASAILNYERALLINPADKDVQFNLNIAKLKTTDKIEPSGEFILTKWITSIQNLLSVDQWGVLGIFCFILFILCLFLYFFSNSLKIRKLGFYFSLFLLFIVVFANIFAFKQKKDLVDRNSAIVFAPTVTIKSSPNVGGTDLFVLHEGTKVRIKRTDGEWNEIELEDGHVGWIRKKDIEQI